MGKQYQTRDATASTPELAIPEEVSVALAEIAHSAREGLLALSVGAGLQVMQTLMEESVTALAGPKGTHDPDRVAVRHGHEQGSVTLGGRRIPVQRPRARAADGSGELPVAAYQLFSQTEVLGRLALERMLGGLSTRRYPLGLEPVGTQVQQAASGTSKSAISRRFVAMTHTALAELLSADLSALDLVCLLVDGVHFGEHTCVVALGIDLDGTSTRWRWWRGPPRTPPWPVTCWWGCANAAWRSPGRSCASSTAPRRCAAPSSTSSTIR
jgi:putative transposase